MGVLKNPIVLPFCGHTFCKDCISEWSNSSSNNKKCPECRTDFGFPIEKVAINLRLKSFVDKLMVYCLHSSIFDNSSISSSSSVISLSNNINNNNNDTNKKRKNNNDYDDIDVKIENNNDSPSISLKKTRISNSNNSSNNSNKNNENEKIPNYCLWIGELQELENHLKNDCLFTQINCSFEGCNQKIMKKDVENHKQNCEFRMVECVYCNQKMVQYLIQVFFIFIFLIIFIYFIKL